MGTYRLMNDYRERFSDYGETRRAAISFHLNELETLLAPTQATRLCLWAMHQVRERNSRATNGTLTLALNYPNQYPPPPLQGAEFFDDSDDESSSDELQR